MTGKPRGARNRSAEGLSAVGTQGIGERGRLSEKQKKWGGLLLVNNRKMSADHSVSSWHLNN